MQAGHGALDRCQAGFGGHGQPCFLRSFLRGTQLGLDPVPFTGEPSYFLLQLFAVLVVFRTAQ
jgi:hypothetical protein